MVYLGLKTWKLRLDLFNLQHWELNELITEEAILHHI